MRDKIKTGPLSSSSSSLWRIVFATKDYKRFGRWCFRSTRAGAGARSTGQWLGRFSIAQDDERTTSVNRLVFQHFFCRSRIFAIAVPPRLAQLEPMSLFRLAHLWQILIRNGADDLRRELRLSTERRSDGCCELRGWYRCGFWLYWSVLDHGTLRLSANMWSHSSSWKTRIRLSLGIREGWGNRWVGILRTSLWRGRQIQGCRWKRIRRASRDGIRGIEMRPATSNA